MLKNLKRKDIKVSVVIPVYNRTTVLEKALLSVLNQSQSVHEIIVVDDGSDDCNRRAIKEIVQRLGENISLLCIDHCGKAGKVRNVGIKKACGDLIAFLDSDDVWHQEKIEMQVPYMQQYKLCHTRETWQRQGREVSQKNQKHTREGNIFFDALHKCIIGPSTVMLHKDVFTTYGLFREDMEVAEDYELWLRITAYENVSYVDKPLVIKYDEVDDLQLSKKYPYIEKFRIEALEPLVKKNIFLPHMQDMAEKVLKRKREIWNNGAKKRQV